MAAKRRKKANTQTIVEGVRLDLVNESLVRKAYREAREAMQAMAEPPMQLPNDDSMSLETVVGTLVLWYRVSSPQEDLCDCSTCGGDSDARLDVCPFCGDAAVDEEPVTESPDTVPEQPAEPSVMTKVGKPKPGKAKGTKSKPKKAAPVEESIVEAEGVEVVDKSALVLADLDEAVMRIDRLKRDAAKGLWDLGVEIKRIVDGNLWKLRLDEAGKGLYRTFQQFCKQELSLSYTHANRLMKVAETFPKETMERHGIGKCSVALYLPKEARDQLLEGAEGKSTSQLSDEAKAIRDGEIDKKPPKGSLTVAMAPGITEIPLMARPKNNARKSSDKPAKSLSDDPWAVEALPNKVHCYYAVIKNKAGELVLRVERRRVSRDEFFPNESEELDDEIEEEED